MAKMEKIDNTKCCPRRGSTEPSLTAGRSVTWYAYFKSYLAELLIWWHRNFTSIISISPAEMHTYIIKRHARMCTATSFWSNSKWDIIQSFLKGWMKKLSCIHITKYYIAVALKVFWKQSSLIWLTEGLISRPPEWVSVENLMEMLIHSRLRESETGGRTQFALKNLPGISEAGRSVRTTSPQQWTWWLWLHWNH